MNRHAVKTSLIALLMCTCFMPSPEALAQTINNERAATTQQDIVLEVTNGNYIELLDVEDIDIREVLEALARKSRFEILIGADIEGRVTIFLTDIDLRDALRIILDQLGMAFSEETLQDAGGERNIIRVMGLGEFQARFGYSFNQQLGTRIVPIVYIDFKDIASVLEALKTPSGKIIFNRDTKTFILMDEPKALKAMEDVIKKFDVPVETKEFVFKTKITETMAQAVKDRLTKDSGRFELNSAKNSMIVTDTALKIQEIRRVVQDLDALGHKVQIDAKVIQIVLAEEHETGVDWEAIVSNYKKLNFTAFDTERVLTKDKEHLSFGTITAEDLNILTEALETVGEIQTVFIDQFIAESQKGIEIVISDLSIATVEDQSPAKAYPLTEEDIKFTVFPRITDPQSIELDIVPSRFRIADREALDRRRQNILMRSMNRGADFLRTASRVIPGMGDADERIEEGDLIEERFHSSVNIDVDNGSTLIIGTMIKEVYVKRPRKIPLLGDLPILGFAFQSEGEQLRNSEVIVFLTVKTINE